MNSEKLNWQTICPLDEIIESMGVCALIGETQVAVFRLENDQLFAIDNFDPFSNANIISRGITGTLQDQIVVASPIYKQHFNLETGQCLEDDNVTLKTYPVQCIDGNVQVASG